MSDLPKSKAMLRKRVRALEAEFAESKRQHRVCIDERFKAEAEIERLKKWNIEELKKYVFRHPEEKEECGR